LRFLDYSFRYRLRDRDDLIKEKNQQLGWVFLLTISDIVQHTAFNEEIFLQ